MCIVSVFHRAKTEPTQNRGGNPLWDLNLGFIYTHLLHLNVIYMGTVCHRTSRLNKSAMLQLYYTSVMLRYASNKTVADCEREVSVVGRREFVWMIHRVGRCLFPLSPSLPRRPRPSSSPPCTAELALIKQCAGVVCTHTVGKLFQNLVARPRFARDFVV